VFFVDALLAAHREQPGASYQSRMTWHNRNPHTAGEGEYSKRLDYIYVGQPEPVTLLGHVQHARVAFDAPVKPGGQYPSDHFGLYVELRAGDHRRSKL